MLKSSLLFFVMLTLSACAGLASTPAPSIQVTSPGVPTGLSTSIPPAPAQQTATPAANLSPTTIPDTLTPTPNADPLPTFPLELTLTPGIMATTTAYAASVTAEYLHYSSLMGPMADMLAIMQYFNPVGMPLKTWHAVPIMSQATAGQEFKTDIYSFRATASLTQASSFYASQIGLLHWSCFLPGTGSAGTGSSADHSSTYMCQGLVIDITSFDNDTAHVIVVINKAP